MAAHSVLPNRACGHPSRRIAVGKRPTALLLRMRSESTREQRRAMCAFLRGDERNLSHAFFSIALSGLPGSASASASTGTR
jgi:hypothetical protein